MIFVLLPFGFYIGFVILIGAFLVYVGKKELKKYNSNEDNLREQNTNKDLYVKTTATFVGYDEVINESGQLMYSPVYEYYVRGKKIRAVERTKYAWKPSKDFEEITEEEIMYNSFEPEKFYTVKSQKMGARLVIFMGLFFIIVPLSFFIFNICCIFLY